MDERRSFRRLIDQAILRQRPIVLDTSALLEFFSGTDPFAPLVARILEDTAIPIVHSALTLSEALVRPSKGGDFELVESIRTALEHRENTRLAVFDSEQAVETAWIRAITNLKLPDSAVIAAARTHEAVGIVGVDRKWRTRELGIPFYYLPDMLEIEEGSGE
jgi:hypothetical protein